MEVLYPQAQQADTEKPNGADDARAQRHHGAHWQWKDHVSST